MCYGSITGNALRQYRSFLNSIQLQKESFDTAMLVTQLNFKMEYLFAVTNEPEMSRLYHPCMDWAYTYFMKFVAIDSIERIIFHAHRRPCRKTNRFKPGVVGILLTVIFVNLSFKNMECKPAFGERRKRRIAIN